ncbi:HAD family hydrolase [Pelagibacterium mangrovi]|uniref:HAD family hydrolase n=1 Tax=Pelagibacterium mangrovi TaxID=3119828 RepID=UPI002FC6B294
MAGFEPELVIFDCDGVLVDSEPIAIDVLIETVAARGVTIGRDAAYRDFLGRTLKTVSAALWTDYGVVMDEAALADMRHRLYARYEGALKPMPGVIDMLGRLDSPACVASSSVYERIEVSLKRTGLYERFFPHIYSAAMVPRGKPAPDLFLHAAREMGVQPGRCLVIEDSPAGVAAAKAAGMAVIAFTGGGHVGPARLEAQLQALEPDAILGDMQMLPNLLRSLRERQKRA